MISMENTENLAISQAQIAEVVQSVAASIALNYGNTNPTLVGVLIGGARFANDVSAALSEMNFRHRLTYIGARKAPGSDKVEVMMYEPPSYHLLHKQRVIILDDLIETGTTMVLLGNYIMRSRPKSIEVGAMLVKTEKMPEWLQQDYCGFHIPTATPIVVGYGLDYNANHREEDGIRLLREEEKLESEPVAG